MQKDFPVSVQGPRTLFSMPDRFGHRKLLELIWPLLLVLLALLLIGALGSWLGSGARGAVHGASEWTRARQEATSLLTLYIQTGLPEYEARFTTELAVPLADRRARQELAKASPDLDAVRTAFLEGRNHPDDVGAMAWMFRYLRFHPGIQRAVDAWSQGDAGIDELRELANTARTVHARSSPDLPALQQLQERTDKVNRELLALERRFSDEIGTTARELAAWHRWLDWAGMALLVVLLCSMTLRMNRQRASAENAAQRASERLKLATLGANDGIWDWHLQSRQIYWTPRVPELLGFPDQTDFRRYVVRDNIHPDDLAESHSMLRNHLAGFTERLQLDLRMRCKDGGFRWFRVRGMALRNAVNEPLRVLGTLSDIHATMMAEQALRTAWSQSQQMAGELELALNGADVALWAYEPTTGTILHHTRWQALLGRETMPATFEGWLQLTHPEDRKQRVKLLNDHLNQLTSYYESEFRMLHQNGQWVWVRSRGRATVRDKDGKALQYAGAVMNISAQMVAREVQRNEQDFLRAMITGIHVGVMVTDFDRILYANHSLARLLDYDHELELNGEPLDMLMSAMERAADLANREKVAMGAVVPIRVVDLRTKTGSQQRVVTHMSCVNWNGKPHFISTVSPLAEHSGLDVHLSAANESFERAMMSELEAQQATIARELHDSLGSILAGISLLLGNARTTAQEHKVAGILERAQDEVKAAAEMTRAMARGILPVGTQSGAFLNALEQFAIDLTELKGIQCTLEADGPFDMVEPDVGNHVYRILQEATTNAIRHGQASRIQVVLEDFDLYYRMTITDNGSGGSVENLEFNTTGVGIRSMRARARTIGASLRLQQAPAGGCQLILKWPATHRTRTSGRYMESDYSQL